MDKRDAGRRLSEKGCCKGTVDKRECGTAVNEKGCEEGYHMWEKGREEGDVGRV